MITAPIRSGRLTTSGWALVLALVYFASAKLGLSGGFWSWLNGIDFGRLGYTIVAAFVVTWIISLLYIGTFGSFIGFDYVIIMYSGVVLGGIGSIMGAFWGGLTVGFVQQVSALVLPPQLQNAAIFIVFLLIVLLRPQGLFGRSAERA